MKTDSLFYRLFQSDPRLVFHLAGQDFPSTQSFRFGSREIKQTGFRLDGLLEPSPDCPDTPLSIVEVQFQPDDDLYLRVCGESLLYLRQYPSGRTWQVIVFYPSSAVERVNPVSAPLLALPNLHRVYLDQLPLLDSPNPKFWLIALVLAQLPRLPEIVERVRRHQREHPDDGVDWLDFLETLLVYKLPHCSREEIQAMFGFNDTELKQTVFYRQVFGEGKREGKLEGKQEGRQEGEAALLLRLLERRFGPVPGNARRRVQEADADTLLLWGERILDANTPEEVWGP